MSKKNINTIYPMEFRGEEMALIHLMAKHMITTLPALKLLDPSEVDEDIEQCLQGLAEKTEFIMKE